MPSLLDTREHAITIEPDGAVVARFPRLRFAGRLRRRRLRRAA
jgi:hypothetical protein